MLDSIDKMPVVFVIARDWNLRTGVRAELRERGVEALGMDVPADAGRAIASGQLPAVVVLEAIPELAGDPGLRKLVESVPTILIASRITSTPGTAGGLLRSAR